MPGSAASTWTGVPASLRCVETAMSVHQQRLGLGHGLLGGDPVGVRVVLLVFHVVILAAPEQRCHGSQETRTGGEREGLGQALGECGGDEVGEELATREISRG